MLNNPLRYVDPFGLTPKCLLFCTPSPGDIMVDEESGTYHTEGEPGDARPITCDAACIGAAWTAAYNAYQGAAWTAAYNAYVGAAWRAAADAYAAATWTAANTIGDTRDTQRREYGVPHSGGGGGGFLGMGIGSGAGDALQSAWDLAVGYPTYAAYYGPNRAIHYGLGDNPVTAAPLLAAEAAGFGVYTGENVVEHLVFDTPAVYTDDRYKSFNPLEHDEPDEPGGDRFYAPGPCSFQVPFLRRSDC